MTPDSIIQTACNIALGILALAFLLTVFRVVRGPTLPDRVMALDMLVGIAIGFIGVIAIRTGYPLYIDIAISLGLVGFLATVAFARFILARGITGETQARPAVVLEPVSGGARDMPKDKHGARKKPAKGKGRDVKDTPPTGSPAGKRRGK